MNVAFVSPEIVPFARSGGLGDVVGALPKSLAALGHRVCLFMPLYRQVRLGPFRLSSTRRQVCVPVGNKLATAQIHSSHLPGTKLPVYFIENKDYFDREEFYLDPATGKDYKDNCQRFVFFSRAVLEAVKVMDVRPDVIHCNDWQSAMIPTYLKTLYAKDTYFQKAISVLTIHNLAYQGLFPKEEMPTTGLDWGYFNWKQLEFFGKVNVLKAGIVFSDLITTVSKKYAEEIQSKEFGVGLDGVLRERSKDLYGIPNGIDYSVWNPEKDKLIPARYNIKNLKGKKTCKRYLQKKVNLEEKNGTPLVGIIGRLTVQKGIDLLIEGWENMMELDLQLVLLGAGEQKYQDALKALAERYPGKASINLGFDDRLSHEIEAGADMFLMPSKFEPCGLNQLYSLKYATVPIVRRTGGLADTVDTSVGFYFENYSARAMLETIKKALEAYQDQERWAELMKNCMLQDWSWNKSAERYSRLYQEALARVRGVE